ncbi:hypothetical protein ASF11_07600 [Acidovorax sp. Leaf76]|uniref:cobalamin biosynthesis protein n=1 Tax=unclassified Acidovorax TaxID=2684926 RepID=UPI0006FBE3FD|nr:MULTISPECIES: cobalamin biosynthesis protein [unclassified Acidovorax]KQO22324.1 hypothetical protein ASF11_07600 [Acidovorax sp. Leaf76]KQO35389.1 hypothetical protein ASF19_06475 [Acidovorax sp. Leaf84]KQS35178.1 hypothetical protein ASG27_06715 [Acidovorax sp. Leaf191]
MPPDSAAGQGHVCRVVGVGLRAHAQPAALHALWAQAQALLRGDVVWAADDLRPCAVAVLDTKAEHPALAAWLSGIAGSAPPVPVRAIPAADLAGQPVATQSPRLQARYGTGSVAEAAALSAAGPGAALAVPRLVAADGSATLAVAVAIRRTGDPACGIAAVALPHAKGPSQERQGASA